jgi:putative chitobiose transport system permease protein
MRGKTGRRIVRSRGGDALVLALLIGVGAFMGLPFLYAIMQALKPMEEIFLFPPRFFVKSPTLDNFYLLTQYAGNTWVPFTRYLFNSLFVTITATAAEVLVCSMAAFVLAKGRLRSRFVFFTIIVLTLLFSYDVTSIPTYVVLSGLRLVNSYGAIIFPAIAVPLGLFLMKQFMETVPDALIESARVDGATPIRVYWSIVMPVVKPAWLTLIIFSFQAIWSREGLEYIYAEALKVLPTMFRQITASGFAWAGIGSAAAVILMVPPIITFVLAQSRVIETMAHSGIK